MKIRTLQRFLVTQCIHSTEMIIILCMLLHCGFMYKGDETDVDVCIILTISAGMGGPSIL